MNAGRTGEWRCALAISYVLAVLACTFCSADAAEQTVRLGAWPSQVVVYSPTGAIRRVFTGFEFPVGVWEPEPGLLAVVDQPQAIISTFRADGNGLRRLFTREPVRFAHPLPGGRWLACLEGPDPVVELDTAGQVLRRFGESVGGAVAAIRRVDGSVTIADGKPPARLLQYGPAGELRATFGEGLAGIGALAALPDGGWAVSSYDSDEIIGLDRALRPVWRYPYLGHCTGIAARADGALALAAPEHFTVRLIDARFETVLEIHPVHPPVAVCFLANGDLAVATRHQPAPEQRGASTPRRGPWRADGALAGCVLGVFCGGVVGWWFVRGRQDGTGGAQPAASVTPPIIHDRLSDWGALFGLAAVGALCQWYLAEHRWERAPWWVTGPYAVSSLLAAFVLNRLVPAGRQKPLPNQTSRTDKRVVPLLLLALICSAFAAWLEYNRPGNLYTLVFYTCALAMVVAGALFPWRVASLHWLRSPDPGLAACMCIPVFGVVGIALWNLADCPRNVHHDMAWCYNSALALLDGKVRTFFSHGYYEIPQLAFLPGAATMALFGRSLFGVRLAAALSGLATVWLVYVLCHPRVGKATAWTAALLLGSCHAHLHFARIGAYIEPIPLQAAALLCLLRSVETGRAALCALAGLLAGLSAQMYYAGRATPVILFGVGIAALWPGVVPIRQLAYGTAAGLVGVAIAVFPLAPVELGDLRSALGRSESVHPFVSPSGLDIDVLRGIVREGWRPALGLFYGEKDTSTQYTPDLPLLVGIVPMFFTWGLGYALLGWRSLFYRVVVIWWGTVLILGGVVATHPQPPFWPRLLGAVAAGHVLVALAAGAIFEAAARSRWKTGRVAGLLLLLALAGAVWRNVDYYFARYCAGCNERGERVFDRTWAEVNLGREIAALGPAWQCYILAPPASPVSIQHGSIRFLANQVDTYDLRRLEDAVPFPGPRTACFVFPGREADLAALRKLYPGARVDARSNRLGEFQYWSVRIENL